MGPWEALLEPWDTLMGPREAEIGPREPQLGLLSAQMGPLGTLIWHLEARLGCYGQIDGHLVGQFLL